MAEFRDPTDRVCRPSHRIVLALVAAGTFWCAAVRAAPVIQEFPLPTANSGPASITGGPDGNLWFVERTERKIGRISASGVVLNEFPMPFESVAPYALTAGVGADLWFIGTDAGSGSPLVGRITQAGSVTTWPLGSQYPSFLEGEIVEAPGGILWFTGGNVIGRFDPAGFPYEPYVLQGAPGAFGITLKSEGLFSSAFWFTERGASKIGRITHDGVVTEFGGLTPGSQPPGIAVGHDGNLWFTERYADKIGRITAQGVVTEFGGLTPGSQPFGIIAAPDGNLWFTENGGNRIGRITTSGTVTEFGGLTAASEPTSITLGPANTLWFTESIGNRIGRVTLPACDVAETIPAAGGSFTRTTLGGSTLAGTCGGPAAEHVFKWTPSRAGNALIETCGGGTHVDTAVYLRTGGSCEGGAEVACSDDVCPTANTSDRGSRLMTFVGKDQTYYIVVDGYGEGTFQLNVLPPAAGCDSPLVVPGSGGSFFGSIDGLSGLQGSCGGAGPERVFQWTPDHSGMATIQTCGAGTDFDTVLYARSVDCHRGGEVACDDDSCPNSTGLDRASRINLEVTAGETYFIFLDSFEHGGNYTLDIIGPAPCDDVETLPAAGGVFNGTTQGANTMAGNCGGNGPEKVYRWTPETSGTATIDTCAGATYETVIHMREEGCLTGVEIACNQLALCSPGFFFSSRIYPEVVAGQTYHIIVDGAGGQSGDFTLSVKAPATPAPTDTATPSATPSSTASATPSQTSTGTPSATASPTPSETPVPTATGTRTSTASATPSVQPTVTVSPTSSASVTPSLTPTPSATATATRTVQPSVTVSPTSSASVTPSITQTPSATATTTRTGGPTFTATPTPSATATGTVTATSTGTPTPTSTPTPVCRGDCNRDGMVTTSELIELVSIALGTGSIEDCAPGDADGDDVISVTELLAAVRSALGECGGGAS